MALGRSRRERSVDYWPGFVDALSTLLLAIMFLLTVFVLAQFFLSREISGKDDVLNRLTSQINELTQLLALEKSGKQDLEDALANLQASLAQSESDRTRLQQLLDSGAGVSDAANARVTTLEGELDSEKQVSARAMSQIELLNQQIAALRSQIAAVEEALQASEAKDKSSQTKIADLGRRLNVAPENVLHVGDHPSMDVAGAKNAGLRSCWIDRGDHAWPDTLAHADLHIPTLTALADWLDAGAFFENAT